MEIVFNKNIEELNRAEIEQYLNPYLFLVPKWCQKVTINLYSQDGAGAISTLVNYEYRWICVDFYSCWFIQDEETKQDNIIHELIHFNVNHLYNEARGAVIQTCGDNEKLKEYAFEQLRMAVESVTQDLSFAIHKWNEKNRAAIKILETECLKAQSQISE